jgi:DNA repair protein RadC
MYSVPQKDVNPLAHTLIDEFGSFGAVLDAGFEQLRKINGVGESTALFLSLLPDFFLKYTASKNVDAIILDTASKMVNYIRTIDRVRSSERFYILCLNGEKKLIKLVKFDTDISSAVGIPLSEFSQKIAFPGNRGIVIMHTHPGGNSMPTDLDIKATKKLIKASNAVGVKIEDHIIITNNAFFSFVDNKLMQGLWNEVLDEDEI